MKNLPKFHNPQLFEQAFTHRSFLNESREKVESNERLEFLGDSILSFVVSDYLYTNYPEFNEGILTNLRSLVVNTKSLAGLARDCEFGKYLRLSKGEEESKGRENESLLANCFEAFIGGLYIDSGIDAVRTFLHEILVPKIQMYVEKKAFKDPKSLLQEFVQSQKQSSPFYKVLNEEGPPHAKIFTIGVVINNEVLGEGTGKSKQEAEENAAKEALTHLKAQKE